jgi:Ser/Thr protein kinase RdoA (MazF antagonist)
MTYIQDSITYNTTNSLQTAFEAGRILGKFHKLLEPASPGEFVDVLPRFHDLGLRRQEYEIAQESARSERLALAGKAIEMAHNLLGDSAFADSENLPTRVCHNDTKLNNILFSATSGKALCFIDLDTIMAGYFLHDFGDAVRTIVNTAPEDERLLEKITFSRTLFKAFVKGLASSKGLLGPGEIESLPRGVVQMPLIHGLRALTDYLNGDKYYQVHYEGQNLDRAVSLFTFASRASEEWEFMQQGLKENLGW